MKRSIANRTYWKKISELGFAFVECLCQPFTVSFNHWNTVLECGEILHTHNTWHDQNWRFQFSGYWFSSVAACIVLGAQLKSQKILTQKSYCLPEYSSDGKSFQIVPQQCSNYLSTDPKEYAEYMRTSCAKFSPISVSNFRSNRPAKIE